MAADGLDISTGGMLAVDSEQLRGVHDQLRQVRDRMEVIPGRLQNVAGLAQDVGQHLGETTLVPRAQQLADEIALTCVNLMTMIETFELVEARMSGRAIIEPQSDRPWWDWIGVTRWFRGPTASERADEVIAEWRADRARAMAEKSAWLGFALSPYLGLGPMTAAMMAALGRVFPRLVGAVGLGVLPPGTRLDAGTDHGRRTGITRNPDPSTPVSGFADAHSRFPKDGQVRVESYEMPDGTARHAVYIGGTQFAPGQPWDMTSNLDLYAGREESASYDAVVRIMKAAGIEPGDPVVVFSHSQGGMIGTHLALSGEFRIEAHNSYGNPVQAESIPGVVDVPVRHKDDPVALLAGAGSSMASDDAVLVERYRFPDAGVGDLAMRSHNFESYTDTARMMDASNDPRLDEMREILARFDKATSITSRDYRVEDLP